jgi:hypothetical protein
MNMAMRIPPIRITIIPMTMTINTLMTLITIMDMITITIIMTMLTIITITPPTTRMKKTRA